MEIKDKVLSVMTKAAKPLKAGEVADLAGIDKKDAEKAIKSLVRDEKIFSPVRCYYAIK